ncbi:MAG: gliding motility-associated C-terminal domain-containing protein [Bacteroidales bacterium]|nr:gliding motility-associated C-terminal domain-containing protein [Bacteroidales bacterium]
MSTVHMSLAQFSATGGAQGSPYVFQPLAGTGLDFVYLFDGNSHAKLYFASENPSLWVWYRYGQDPSLVEPVSVSDVQVVAGQTVLSNVQPGYGYLVDSAGVKKRYVYVVEYKPLLINGIEYSPDCDVCHTLEFSALTNIGDMPYYKAKGTTGAVFIKRSFTLSWNTLEWNGIEKKYETKTRTSALTTDKTPSWSIEAPLTDTRFNINCDDQIARFFGQSAGHQSAIYSAVAVEANPEARVLARNAKNEGGNEDPALVYLSRSAPSGSAPLNIQFYSHASDAVKYNEWYIYHQVDGTGSYNRYMEDHFLYIFRESGDFLVKLVVSNATCKDTANYFTPKVLESFIDCPNFFTPRSSPGENDEFRVAYKSIVFFKGVILNRWGNVLFEWSDPAFGWNGTYKGKAVSPGVYFYVIDARGSDGVVYKKKGDINLLE